MRVIVYNPRGGAAIRGGRLRAALRVLRAQDEPHVLVSTQRVDMAAPIRLALEQHPDATQVIACGGDGTVAACAAAVGTRRVPIGIIPTGTTNVLAWELGLPSNPVRAARLLAGPMQRVPFRTWSVNGTPMLLQLGIGFDGMLMWRTPRRVKRALGFVGVVASALRHSVAFDYPMMRVSGELPDGASFTTAATSVMVANAKRWAGPRLTVPHADPADDLVDVLLLRYERFPQLARFWIALLLPGAPHLRLPFVRSERMRRLRVEGLTRAVEAHVDGEPDLRTPLSVEPLGLVELLGPPVARSPGPA